MRGLLFLASVSGLAFGVPTWSIARADVRGVAAEVALHRQVVIRLAPGATVGDVRLAVASDAPLARALSQSAIRPAMDSPAKNAEFAARLGLDRFYTVDLPDDLSEADGIALLRASGGLVEVAEGQGRAELNSDDPLFPQQWHLQNTGQNGGTPGADMRGSAAWYMFSSFQPVVVAVIDSGVSTSHPDLAGVLVAGRNVINSNANTDDDPNTSHGTYCAGIAAAVYGNAVGVAGVALNARIMPIRIMQNGITNQTTVGNGLKWAAENGAKVASMSLSFAAGTTVTYLQTQVQYASGLGVVIVASTGNTPGVEIGYPAAFPEVIAVGATDRNDLPFTGQTAGVVGRMMDLSAPGVEIETTVDQNNNLNGYGLLTGTSMACPMVAATAAMVWGVNPTLTAAQVRSIVEGTTDDLGAPGPDRTYGMGRLNAAHAVGAAIGTLPCTVDVNGDTVVNLSDLYMFLGWYFAKNIAADYNHDGVVATGDLFAFLTAWFAGCGTPTLLGGPVNDLLIAYNQNIE